MNNRLISLFDHRWHRNVYIGSIEVSDESSEKEKENDEVPDKDAFADHLCFTVNTKVSDLNIMLQYM